MTHDPSQNGADQGQEARPPGPGRRLREQREALGLPLAQVAQDMRILRSVLQAMEEDRYEVLEAPIFVRGHLRNYARLLNLPPDEIVEAYERSLPSPEETPELRIDAGRGPAMHDGIPGWVSAVAWLLLLTMLVLGGLWWYAGPHREPIGALEAEQETEPVASASSVDSGERESTAEPETGGGASGSTADEESVELFEPLELADTEVDVSQETVDETTGETTDEAVDEGADEMSSSESPVDADSRQRAEPAPGPIADVAPGERRELTLSLDEDSWLEVHDADERQLYYGLAVAGEELTLVGRAPISLFMGNAPAVAISVDGEVHDFSGRIRRDNTARITIAPREE